MTNPTPPVALTVEELDALQVLLKAAHPLPWGEVGGVRGNANRQLVEVAVNALPALIAAARRLLELESAIGFMNERGHWQNTWPDCIKQRARDFGWIPPGEQKGGADG